MSSLKPPPWRREVVSLDGQLRVFVLQYSGILLKYLPVPSGVAGKGYSFVIMVGINAYLVSSV